MASRIENEKHVVSLMIRLYCRHYEGNSELCPHCRQLTDYAHKRLSQCRYGNRKGSCRHCATHCYRPDMRSDIRRVMQWAGPRMIWHHPLIAIHHLLLSLTAGRKGSHKAK